MSGFSVPVASISINSSLAGGAQKAEKLYLPAIQKWVSAHGMYVPGTLTIKQTWQDAGETILNTNPIQLDQNGCAVIFGSGTYRQIVYDSLGNEVWDKLTYGFTNNPYWASLAGGTPNAITVTDGAFSGTDGQGIVFRAAFNNTGAATLNPSSFGAVTMMQRPLLLRWAARSWSRRGSNRSPQIQMLNA